MQTVEEVRSALQGDGNTPVTSLVSLIRLAIEDGREMLAQYSKVRPDYSVWWRNSRYEGCAACLAGAVMLGTLGARGTQGGFAGTALENCDVINSDGLVLMYKRHQVNALSALDRVRAGAIQAAYRALGLWEDSQFRSELDRLLFKRRKRSPQKRQAPARQFFQSREAFQEHLAALDELAGELEGVEALFLHAEEVPA